jgi:hypothetical protein
MNAPTFVWYNNSDGTILIAHHTFLTILRTAPVWDL